ncbi:MAG: hypothetical protein DWQ08_15740 [Proteobacteria bacterium]|nr:MAG: hypothetical protein DWQ08_15740 [Pseudomonadota bacterium]
MSLRKSIVTTVTLSLVTLIAILYAVTKGNLAESFDMLERAAAREDLSRLARAIQSQADALDTLVRDWATWDDTYDFIENGSPAFAESNLGDVTLTNANLRIIAFIDNAGRLRYGKAWDEARGESGPLPEAFLQRLGSDERLRLKTPGQGLAGTLVVPGLELIIAARPIVTSENEGPVRGTLIMARDLDESMVTSIARITALDIDVEPLEAPGNDGAISLDVAGADTITASRQYRDAFGEPSLLLKVSSPRSIYRAGQESLRFFLVSLIIVGAVLVILVVLLLDRLVLLPLKRLNRAVVGFVESGEYQSSIKMVGYGELAQFSRSIGQLFSDIKSTRTELETANSRLERSVKERTDELVEARDAAIDALKTKERLLANVGHDSRTPLNTIVLRAELMKTGRYGPVTAQQSTALDSIVASVNQLNLFTTNLLYEAQSDRDEISVRNETFDIENELRRIVDMMEPLADRKQLELTLNLGPDLPRDIHLDRQAFQQIVSNLVDNAIKFTDQGRVSVHVERHDPEHLNVIVKDSGRGIPVPLRELVFDAFWQADGSVTREANRGVGLGLSIVRTLVDRLHGRIEIRDSSDGGTEFIVTLPTGVGFIDADVE